MFLKKSCISIILYLCFSEFLVNFFASSTDIPTDNENDCSTTVIIEGGEDTLRKIFSDFPIIKTTVNELSESLKGIKTIVEDFKGKVDDLKSSQESYQKELNEIKTIIQTNSYEAYRKDLNEAKNIIQTNSESIHELLNETKVIKTEFTSHSSNFNENFNQVFNKTNDSNLKFEQIQMDINEIKTKQQDLKDYLNNEIKNNINVSISHLKNNLETILNEVKKEKAQKIRDCSKASFSGIYEIHSDFISMPFRVACDAKTKNGGWLVIQQRKDGSVDFYQDWEHYKHGFGNLMGEYFIGLEKLYYLTNSYETQELMIVMKDKNGTEVFAKYDAFSIGDESESYKLKTLGSYAGTAEDSLSRHKGMKFTTKDRDNDDNSSHNCAIDSMGGWWYLYNSYCHLSNLNGKYGNDNKEEGINWYRFRGDAYSLPYVKMMIRPKGFRQ